MIDANQLEAVKTIHFNLHKKFIWVSDEELFEKPENWDRLIPDKKGKLRGDCDDWSVEIDHLLHAIKIPLDDRRIALCRLDKKNKTQDHCTLAVIGPENEIWISDCNTTYLTRLKSLPYDMWVWSPIGEAMDKGKWEPIIA